MQTGDGERIAFIGGGNMARALIAGLLRQGLPAAQISVGEPRAATREALARDFGVVVCPDNDAALAGATLVVLAVKPQDASQALAALHGSTTLPSLLSIAAGLPIRRLAEGCPPATSIVRAMPNRPALVGAGITGLYAPAEVPAAVRARAERVVSAAGRVVWLREERELDLVTALSGSGPAYFFLLAEELARAAEAGGLAADTAALLAAETLYGAGQLAHHVLAEGRAELASLAAERIAVTSRGGTTEAALNVLQNGDFGALVARALQAAAARSAELAHVSAPKQGTAGPPTAKGN